MKWREAGRPCKEVGGLASLSVGEIRTAFPHDSNLREWLASGYFCNDLV